MTPTNIPLAEYLDQFDPPAELVERARVVAWLRGRAMHQSDAANHFENVIAEVARSTAGALADAIERGEHLEGLATPPETR